ncbi:MAG: sulfatase-like hydrolase/transferase [Caldilineaceae bacterium]
MHLHNHDNQHSSHHSRRHGPRRFGAFNPAVHTPTLDQLVAESLCLTQHYSGSPVCSPARAALLTGRYPHRTGALTPQEMLGLD